MVPIHAAMAGLPLPMGWDTREGRFESAVPPSQGPLHRSLRCTIDFVPEHGGFRG